MYRSNRLEIQHRYSFTTRIPEMLGRCAHVCRVYVEYVELNTHFKNRHWKKNWDIKIISSKLKHRMHKIFV